MKPRPTIERLHRVLRCDAGRLYSDSEIAAARAYNEAATRLHGQFARLNQIDGSTA